MSVNCEILFDNNSNNSVGVYYSGQTLSGTLRLSLDKVTSIKGLILQVCGYARCSWEESHTVNGNPNVMVYTGREEYLRLNFNLIGPVQGRPVEFPPGIRFFRFSCMLPPILPTSFEAPHGHIRYLVKATLQRPWKLDNSFVCGFTVIKPLDLNCIVPSLYFPFTMETVKKFWFPFGSSNNKLHMTATIPISGFVAGQDVNVVAEINNQSKIDVVYLKISLKRIIIYRSTSPSNSKREVRTAGDKKCLGVSGKERKCFDEVFRIPAVPPTNLLCSVIQIRYELQLKAKVSGFNKSPVMRFPITIGTIPLSVHADQSAGLYPDLSSLHENDLPPPSYEECMQNDLFQLDEEDRTAVLQCDFKPRYPVYQFPHC